MNSSQNTFHHCQHLFKTKSKPHAIKRGAAIVQWIPFHPAAPGSISIYAFSYYILTLMRKWRKWKQKEAGICPLFTRRYRLNCVKAFSRASSQLHILLQGVIDSGIIKEIEKFLFFCFQLNPSGPYLIYTSLKCWKRATGKINCII